MATTAKNIPLAKPAVNGTSPRLSQQVRRTQVIEAAIQLFAQQGFQATTTKKIAAAAGINEALIFRYFKTKHDLYSAILDYESQRLNTERWIQQLSRYVEHRNDHALFSGLAKRLIENSPGKREVFKLTLYSALDRHELARMFREKQMLPLENFLRDYVVLRQGEGAFEASDARAVARGFICMCAHHAMLNILFSKQSDGLTTDQAVRNFTNVFLNGLRQGRQE